MAGYVRDAASHRARIGGSRCCEAGKNAEHDHQGGEEETYPRTRNPELNTSTSFAKMVPKGVCEMLMLV